jgi:class 3 adenylate cyclase
MKTPSLSPLRLGFLLAAAYWLLESVLHTFVFGDGGWASNLVGGHDPNELWMRLFTSLLLVGAGWVAERSVRAERHLRDDARRLGDLLRFVQHVRQGVEHAPGEAAAWTARAPTVAPPPLPETSAPPDPGRGRHPPDTGIGTDEIGTLSRMLEDLSRLLEIRLKELTFLLQLTHEINEGLLLDEILERAYETLRSVIPCSRLGIALLEDDGRTACSRWVRSDRPEVLLGTGYRAPIRGSSLERIIDSQEPRIINDLEQYLAEHPRSESTRLMVAEGIRSSLTCPLVAMGKPVGFAFFSSRRKDAYRAVHVDMFKLITGHFAVVVDRSSTYQQILQEKERSESLLLNVMPARIADRLRSGEQDVAECLPDVGVLFADIAGFTDSAGALPPESVVGVLRDIFGRFDHLCDRYGAEKIKTVGDEYIAIAGPPAAGDGGHLARIAELALAMLESAGSVRYPDGRTVRIRVGLHAGPVVAGVIGQKKFAYDIWGDTVNVASRMESTGEAGRIQVTEAVYTRLREEFLFECRGRIEVKGKGGMATYFLDSRQPTTGGAPQAPRECER